MSPSTNLLVSSDHTLMWAYTPQHCNIPGLDFLIPHCDNVGFLVFYPPPQNAYFENDCLSGIAQSWHYWLGNSFVTEGYLTQWHI